jgi:hypothetical protein
MDPKAAAKSKRSHTVHGRRAHQTPAAAAAHRQKRAAAASSAPRRRDLPSNWDRYDAEGEADDPAAAAEWTGEVAPRSKGADFGFLLDQARAQPREARDLSKPWLPSQDSPFGKETQWPPVAAVSLILHFRYLLIEVCSLAIWRGCFKLE